MDQATRPTIPTRPLRSGPPLPEAERLERMRRFVRMVIQTYEESGAVIPADDPLRRFADGGARVTHPTRPLFAHQSDRTHGFVLDAECSSPLADR